MKKKSKVNKILVGIFLGTAIGGIGVYSSKNKKSKLFFKKIKNDIFAGINEMKKSFGILKNKYAKKKK